MLLFQVGLNADAAPGMMVLLGLKTGKRQAAGVCLFSACKKKVGHGACLLRDSRGWRGGGHGRQAFLQNAAQTSLNRRWMRWGHA